jgi:hypothetical protein
MPPGRIPVNAGRRRMTAVAIPRNPHEHVLEALLPELAEEIVTLDGLDDPDQVAACATR